MPTTAAGRIKGARHLIHMTGLDEHVIAKQYLNYDSSPDSWNWDGLFTDERFSTGERIAIHILAIVAGLNSGLALKEMYELDDDYRRVCLDALAMAMIGDEAPVL